MFNYDDDLEEGEIRCDLCDECEVVEGLSFSGALDFAFALGWKSYKDSHGDWAHQCPGCQRDTATAPLFGEDT